MNRILLAILVGALLCGSAQATPWQGKWNLVLILADDHASWALGAYGNTEVKTPNIDRLAAQGARFANAFATSPVCTPSRLNLVTGMESTQLGTLNDPTSGAPLGALPYGSPSWARELKKAGYHTGFIGKWHLGDDPGHSPLHYGFDYFYGFQAGAMYAKDPLLARGSDKHRRVQGFTDDLLTDDALAYLKSVKDQPFVLSLNFRGPHLPYLPQPQEDVDAVKDVDPTVPKLGDPGIDGARIEGTRDATTRFLKDQRREYYAAAHNVDRNLGRLLTALDELGLADHTIVVYTSDNGYLLGERGLFNKGPAAPIQYDMYPDNRLLWAINLWDISLRVPMIVRWPGVAQPGAQLPHFVTLTDLYRSLLGMLNVPLPKNAPVGGMDFSALLRGREVKWRDAVFGQYTSDRIGNTEFVRMIRTDRWKLVLSYLNPSANQLYDLVNDPQELKNLYWPRAKLQANPDGTVELVAGSDANRAVREELEKRLREWQKSIDDPALALEREYEKRKQRALGRWQAAPKDAAP